MRINEIHDMIGIFPELIIYAKSIKLLNLYSRLASTLITQLQHSFHSLLLIYIKILVTLRSYGFTPSKPQIFNPTRLCHPFLSLISY